MSQWRKRVKYGGCLVLVAMLGLLTIFLYATHGLTWSIKSMNYDRVLNSLPTPPRFQPETDQIEATAYWSHGWRRYDVDGSYAETVSFFQDELPNLGWYFLNKEEYSSVTGQYRGTNLSFRNSHQYVIEIEMSAAFDAKGNTQVAGSMTNIRITITNPETTATLPEILELIEWKIHRFTNGS